MFKCNNCSYQTVHKHNRMGHNKSKHDHSSNQAQAGAIEQGVYIITLPLDKIYKVD